MIIWIVILGIVTNFICIGIAADNEPEGAMGMAPALLLCFIPFLFPIIFVLSKIADFFGWGR